MYDVAVIGCGIVGAAAAFELSRYRLSAVVLEAENDVADCTTKANSAIIHAGYDPEPGTLMAKLNVEGNRLTKALCEKLDVPYRQCGALVLAFSQQDLAMLEKLLGRGIENGVPDLALLSAEQVKQREPHVSGEVLAALLAPTAGIVSPWEYALALAETAVRNGVALRLNHSVTEIKKTTGGYRLGTSGGPVEARYVLNAAGLHADTVHNMIAEPAFEIIPDKGVYYLLDKAEGGRVNHVIFQCPTKVGKGTLIAPTVHGNLIIGPNNEKPAYRDDTAATRDGLEGVAAMARKSVPSVDLRQSIRNFVGVRAASDIDDFIITQVKDAQGFIDIAGIKSPGLSAAPAIAKMAVELLGQAGLQLTPNPDFTEARMRRRFGELSIDEKAALVKENASYGRVICRCETITEGEIMDALHAPIPPVSVEGVKRRCGAGMGRCQGGFCGPRVVEILSRELGVPPLEILYDKEGSVIFTGETKGGGQDV